MPRKTRSKKRRKSTRKSSKKKKASSKQETIKKRKASTLKKMKGLGNTVYSQMIKGEFPRLKISSRSTSNILYDDELGQYRLDDKSVTRSARNVRHIRPFTQLIWTASFTHDLSKAGKTSTLRDIYYSAQAFDIDFRNQRESDNIITDLETILGHSREEFNVYPEERSSIFGDLTIEYTVKGYEGIRTNLTSHPDGFMIGPALSTAELISSKANKVIVIEKGAMFTRFVEEQAFKKFKALLIHTAGQPPRLTRYIIRRLNDELGLPVYVFCDGDPWGMAIAITIICGSANAAHLSGLTTPEATWMGLYSSDIQKYDLPSEKLKEVDIKRLYDMRKDPRCQEEPWKTQINHFIKNKRKCELEAFSRYGLDYVVKKYLPERLA